MAQVGVYSAALLMQHSHLDANQGGVLNDYSRFGAYRESVSSGATCVIPHDPEGDEAALILSLVKEIRINLAYRGTFNITWQYRSTDGINNVETRFYVNGAPQGALYVTSNIAYQNVAETYLVDFAQNDLVQLYARATNAATSCRYRNFRITYDWELQYFGDGTYFNLAVPLALTDADLLDYTLTL